MRQRRERSVGEWWMISAAGAALSIGMVMGATGCSAKSDSPSEAKSSTTTVAAASVSPEPVSNTAWNPCSIPDADIAAAGLNPAKKHPDTGKYSEKFPGWDICGWLSNSWYSLNIYSTNSHTFDEVINNTTLFRDPQPVSVGERRGVLLHHVDNPQACTIALDIPNDPVQMDVDAKASADTVGDSCSEVTRIARVLEKDLPAGK
ncbi:DUF3558 domain-containing protein [Nocardia nova]|uniref:DUF3558 domain-containing protein n=1 Tax=Nocardia nova TaxID=37330 RepID=UPI003792F2DD